MRDRLITIQDDRMDLQVPEKFAVDTKKPGEESPAGLAPP